MKLIKDSRFNTIWLRRTTRCNKKSWNLKFRTWRVLWPHMKRTCRRSWLMKKPTISCCAIMKRDCTSWRATSLKELAEYSSSMSSRRHGLTHPQFSPTCIRSTQNSRGKIWSLTSSSIRTLSTSSHPLVWSLYWSRLLQLSVLSSPSQQLKARAISVLMQDAKLHCGKSQLDKERVFWLLFYAQFSLAPKGRRSIGLSSLSPPRCCTIRTERCIPS